MKKLLSNREFFGEDFYKFCQKSYDAARVFLKNCGKPKNDVDITLIQIAKEESVFYKKLLD